MKRILLKIIKYIYFFKAKCFFWLYGPYGVCDLIKTVPYPFIQPLLIKYGAKIGKNCVIDTSLQLHRPDRHLPFKNLTIGDSVYIGHNTIIDLTTEVEIDSYTALGAFCQIWTHTGDWTYNKDDEKEKINPVNIGKACIIYSGSIISQGVSIGNYVRVGAGSVVLKNINEYEFVAGIPAKLIKIRRF